MAKTREVTVPADSVEDIEAEAAAQFKDRLKQPGKKGENFRAFLDKFFADEGGEDHVVELLSHPKENSDDIDRAMEGFDAMEEVKGSFANWFRKMVETEYGSKKDVKLSAHGAENQTIMGHLESAIIEILKESDGVERLQEIKSTCEEYFITVATVEAAMQALQKGKEKLKVDDIKNMEAELTIASKAYEKVPEKSFYQKAKEKVMFWKKPAAPTAAEKVAKQRIAKIEESYGVNRQTIKDTLAEVSDLLTAIEGLRQDRQTILEALDADSKILKHVADKAKTLIARDGSKETPILKGLRGGLHEGDEHLGHMGTSVDEADDKLTASYNERVGGIFDSIDGKRGTLDKAVKSLTALLSEKPDDDFREEVVDALQERIDVETDKKTKFALAELKGMLTNNEI